MNQTEETKLLEQIEEWNDADEFSRCIEAIEAIPEQERDYLLTVKLSRAYSNLAVLGDHGEHGTDSEVDGNLIQHAIRLLESVRTQGENDPYWNSRMGYSCLMAYSSAAIAYEYAKRWLSLAPDDPAAQKLVRDCEEYLEEEKALEIDLKEREEFIRRETPDDEKGVLCDKQTLKRCNSASLRLLPHRRSRPLCHTFRAFRHKQDSTLVAEQTAISSIFAFFVSIYSVFVERPG